jgi:hypothetical protein
MEYEIVKAVSNCPKIGVHGVVSWQVCKLCAYHGKKECHKVDL